MNQLEKLFATKRTENGDISYNTTGNNLLDILFMTSYYEKHLDEVHIGTSDREKLFSMFIRDPRFGLGRRDLGRRLLGMSKVSAEDVVKCGRYDDLLLTGTEDTEQLFSYTDYMYHQAMNGNQLAKKWFPRLTSSNRELAKALCMYFKITEKEYRKLIKAETTEKQLTEKRTSEIDFEKVPSLAMIKYYNRFLTGEDTKQRFQKYLDSVKKGEKKLNISTANVYDIYRNREKIDADLYFDKLEKIKISCIPILDTSGSMFDGNDSIGKAMSIAHYLSKCSTYCNGQLIGFSSNPHLIKIEEKNGREGYYGNFGNSNKYSRELNSMYTGDCANTDFGKVMKLLEKLEELPEYLVVLSDMEFDYGSNQSKKELQKLWKEKGYTTKIVWWNFNSRNKTVPETDEMGNIYLSGYSPMLLKYLEAGFDGNMFLEQLLEEYKERIK